ncbi:hypothetical protein CCMA1212_000766 [Trichoderma ghanense]|uniref:Uncharacterized protein n=1 Tax=Trichoderma ghanense TaxID=65468 RepID=A0ABY2HHB3_9HYPO
MTKQSKTESTTHSAHPIPMSQTASSDEYKTGTHLLTKFLFSDRVSSPVLFPLRQSPSAAQQTAAWATSTCGFSPVTPSLAAMPPDSPVERRLEFP